MVARIENKKKSIDETEHANYLCFASFLKRVGYNSIADKISCQADKIKNGRGGSINGLYYVNHIKRPISTFDENLFAQLDKDIFDKD